MTIYESRIYRVEDTGRNGYRLVDKRVGTSVFFNDVKFRDSQDLVELRILRSQPGWKSGELMDIHSLPPGLRSELSRIAESDFIDT